MKTILLIEDNTALRENTSEILSLAGYKILSAENGKKGVEIAKTAHPDLIVCDIMMPELDGYGVLHILSKLKETSEIPFIFLTAKTEKSDLRKGMTMGADDYLTKPFDETELLDSIGTRLKKNELRKGNYGSSDAGLENFIHDASEVMHFAGLCKDRKSKSVKKKYDLFSEGDTPQHIFFIKSGSIKVFKSHPDGKELIMAIHKSGDYFGFEPLLEKTDYPVSAVALEDSELILIPAHDFMLLINSHPDISAGFISLLCKRVAEKENQLLNLAYNSVRQRIAEALLRSGEVMDGQIKITLSREDLARIAGTASESVIRVLSDFKDEKLIDISRGKITVTEPAKIQKIVRWNVVR